MIDIQNFIGRESPTVSETMQCIDMGKLSELDKMWIKLYGE